MTPDVFPGDTPPIAARSVYDAAEVDAYLAEVRSELEDLRSQLHAAVARAATLEQQLADSAWSEGVIGRALIRAERTSEDIKGNARRDVEAELASARQQVEAMLAEARDHAMLIIESARKGPTSDPSQPAPRREEQPGPGDAFAPPAELTTPPEVRPRRVEAPLGPYPSSAKADLHLTEPPATSTASNSARVVPAVLSEAKDRWQAFRHGYLSMVDDLKTASEERFDDDAFFEHLRGAADNGDDPHVVKVATTDEHVVDVADVVTSGELGTMSLSERGALEPFSLLPTADSSRKTARARGDLFAGLGWVVLGLISPSRMAHRQPRRRTLA